MNQTKQHQYVDGARQPVERLQHIVAADDEIAVDEGLRPGHLGLANHRAQEVEPGDGQTVLDRRDDVVVTEMLERIVRKRVDLRFVELALLYGACLLLGRLAESRLHGAPYPQSWEFYVIGICLFLVAAFPGFIYRYMWRKDG